MELYEIKSGTRWLGRIEWFDARKGFGFLSGPNSQLPAGRGEFFFHVRDVQNGIPEIGRKVTFEPSECSKGKIALRVEVIVRALELIQALKPLAIEKGAWEPLKILLDSGKTPEEIRGRGNRRPRMQHVHRNADR